MWQYFFGVASDWEWKLFKPEEATIAYIRGHRYYADPSQCAALLLAKELRGPLSSIRLLRKQNGECTRKVYQYVRWEHLKYIQKNVDLREQLIDTIFSHKSKFFSYMYWLFGQRLVLPVPNNEIEEWVGSSAGVTPANPFKLPNLPHSYYAAGSPNLWGNIGLLLSPS